jgi:hypothetical protein
MNFPEVCRQSGPHCHPHSHPIIQLCTCSDQLYLPNSSITLIFPANLHQTIPWISWYTHVYVPIVRYDPYSTKLAPERQRARPCRRMERIYIQEIFKEQESDTYDRGCGWAQRACWNHSYGWNWTGPGAVGGRVNKGGGQRSGGAMAVGGMSW